MKTRTAVRISLILLATMVAMAAAAFGADYKVVKTWKLGGDGGWDYLTMDSDGHRLFIARATRVMVIDTESGKQVGEIPETTGVHGVALVPQIGRGFTSNGREDTVSVFDLKSLAVEKKIKVGSGPDAILYDPFSKRVFTFNGKGHDATAVDASKGEVVGKIELGGKPEFAATDAKGTVFVNIEDTSELVALDPQKLTIKSRWKLAGCEEPTGLTHRREEPSVVCRLRREQDDGGGRCGHRENSGESRHRRRMRCHRIRCRSGPGVCLRGRRHHHGDSP